MTRVDDLSRSVVAFDQATSLTVVVGMSQSNWLVAGMLPGVVRQPLNREARKNHHVSKPFGQAVLLVAGEGTTAAPDDAAFPAAPPATAAVELESTLPVFDRATFEAITDSLSETDLASNLQILDARGEALL